MEPANGTEPRPSEVSVSNQRSVRKTRRGFRMPKVTLVGRLAKVSKGPAPKRDGGKKSAKRL